jgi:hypothetical protein
MEAQILGALQAMLGSDNAVRSAAEQWHAKVLQESPGHVCVALVDLLSGEAPSMGSGCSDGANFEAVQTLAAILLRRMLEYSSCARWWHQMQNATPSGGQEFGNFLAAVKGKLMAAMFTLMSVPHLCRKCTMVISQLMGSMHSLNISAGTSSSQDCCLWPELSTALSALTNSSDGPQNRRVGMELTKSLAEASPSFLKPFAMNLFQSCYQNIGPYGIEISGTAVKACTALFLSMPEFATMISPGSSYEQACVEFLGVIVKTSDSAAKEGDDLTARSSLECLVQLAERRSKLFKINGVAQKIVFELTMVAVGNNDADEAVVELATEVLVTLAESCPKYMKKVEGFLQSIITISLNLLSSGMLEDFGLQGDQEKQVVCVVTATSAAFFVDFVVFRFPISIVPVNR